MHVCTFRIGGHRLPIEVGGFNNLPRNMRTCYVCNTDRSGDEFPFRFQCKVLDNLRTKYFKPVYIERMGMLLNLTS